MQTQEIGRFIIEIPEDKITAQRNKTGDKQEDYTDNTNYECMEQVEEFDFDAASHTDATDDAQTNNAEVIYTQICREWGQYLQQTQAIAETQHKLPTTRELWQLLPEGPDKNPTQKVLFQSHLRTVKLQEHRIGPNSDTLEAQAWMVQTVQKLHDVDYNLTSATY